MASRREARVWDKRDRVAGPGMEAQETVWPRWGRWCRLESSLDRAGLMIVRDRSWGSWGAEQVVC